MKKPVPEMSIIEVIAELREGRWVSSRNEADFTRRMQLWARIDAHVAKRAEEASLRQSSR